MKSAQAIIFLILITFCDCDYVIIQFKEVEDYCYEWLSSYGTEFKNTVDRKNYVTFCEDLLTAKIFEKKHEVGDPLPELGEHAIPKHKFIEIVHQMETNNCCRIREKKFPLSYFSCLNHYQAPIWAVAYDVALGTGFLFKGMGPLKKLHALIDRSTKLEKLSKLDFGNSLTSSLDKNKRMETGSSVTSEPLCLLKTNSIFRLCAICADAYFRSVAENVYPYHNEKDELVFGEPYFNNIEQILKENICPLMRIPVRRTRFYEHIYSNVLLCQVNQRGNNQYFYLKKNDELSVYFMLADSYHSEIELYYEISVPQLKNM